MQSYNNEYGGVVIPPDLYTKSDDCERLPAVRVAFFWLGTVVDKSIAIRKPYITTYGFAVLPNFFSQEKQPVV